MGTSKLQDFLFSTDSVKSLMIEEEIAVKLKRFGWDVEQGSYYTDIHENKTREMDIKAVQHWGRSSSSGIQGLNLNLVLECKSIKDSNIIFVPKLEAELTKISRISYWIGQESQEESGQLQVELLRLGLERHLFTKLAEIFVKKAFPAGVAKIEKLLIDPPSAQYQSTAFREVSSRNEKDLENSVLWRAAQSVSAAIESDFAKSKQFHIESLVERLRYSEEPGHVASQPAIVEEFNFGANFVEIWHPIVVLDAKLWALSNRKLSPINWFRFGPFRENKEYSLWCDVVNRDSFDSYIKHISTNYSNHCLQAKAKHDFLPYKINKNESRIKKPNE